MTTPIATTPPRALSTHEWFALITDWLIVGGALVFFIATFLPWYTIETRALDLHLVQHVTAWSDWPGTIAGVLALVLLAFWVVRLVVHPPLPLSDTVIQGLLGGGMLIFTLLYLIRARAETSPSLGLAAIGITVGPDVGWFLGVFAALAVVVGSFLHSEMLTRLQALLRQRVFLGGIALGVIVGLLFALAGSFISNPRGLSYRLVTPATAAGTFTFIASDDVLTLGARVAIQHVQDKLPFTITNAQVRALAGDTLELTADGPAVAGIVPNLLMTLQPQVTKASTLDFNVDRIELSGLSVTLGGVVSSIVGNALASYFTQYAQGQIQGINYHLVEVHTTLEGLALAVKLNQSPNKPA